MCVCECVFAGSSKQARTCKLRLCVYVCVCVYVRVYVRVCTCVFVRAWRVNVHVRSAWEG